MINVLKYRQMAYNKCLFFAFILFCAFIFFYFKLHWELIGIGLLLVKTFGFMLLFIGAWYLNFSMLEKAKSSQKDLQAALRTANVAKWKSAIKNLYKELAVVVVSVLTLFVLKYFFKNIWQLNLCIFICIVYVLTCALVCPATHHVKKEEASMDVKSMRDVAFAQSFIALSVSFWLIEKVVTYIRAN